MLNFRVKITAKQIAEIVVAISGSTIGLANKGLLNSNWHTSNDLEYLKLICPNYAVNIIPWCRQ
jgi:hypothetical protein